MGMHGFILGHITGWGWRADDFDPSSLNGG
jgi:hypothetical protein